MVKLGKWNHGITELELETVQREAEKFDSGAISVQEAVDIYKRRLEVWRKSPNVESWDDVLSFNQRVLDTFGKAFPLEVYGELYFELTKIALVGKDKFTVSAAEIESDRMFKSLGWNLCAYGCDVADLD